MQRYLVATFMMMIGSLGYGGVALAQDATQPTYVVTYVEIVPSLASEARQLILAHSADAAKASGAVKIDALERVGYSSHFALIEQWQSSSAKQAYGATDAAMKFRAALGPLQSAAYDERIQAPLAVGPSSLGSADPLVIMTHVAFVEQGRGAAGNRRFDVLVQTSRKNHMTIIENWDAPADKTSWISTAVARSFREDLQPTSGSLYDERAYRLLR
jgi:quinol monooxygenase YgiN